MTDHIKIRSSSGPGNACSFWCKHCGVLEKLDSPVELSAFSKKAKAFEKAHKDCREEDA